MNHHVKEIVITLMLCITFLLTVGGAITAGVIAEVQGAHVKEKCIASGNVIKHGQHGNYMCVKPSK